MILDLLIKIFSAIIAVILSLVGLNWGGSSNPGGTPSPTTTPSTSTPVVTTTPTTPGTSDPSTPPSPTTEPQPTPGDRPEPEDAHTRHHSGWTPTEFDTCSAELHSSFSAVGADGKRYDTWHPPTMVDPATGLECTFGHEHGDDPEMSKIYDFVLSHLAAEGYEDLAGLAFGIAAEASDEYAEQDGSGVAHRHEDHVGHKVFVANDVTLVHEDRSLGYVRNASGEPTTCNYLMKFHQGTHSSDAIKNNAHELIYGVQCNDGTEMVTTHLSMLGQPNEFTKVCSDDIVATAGSNMPGQDAGRIRIPDAECLSGNDDIWATYELWETDAALTTASGEVIAAFDPWFGVRNPSRYFDNNAEDLSEGTRPMIEYFGGSAEDKNNPSSPYNGAQRDFYVQRSTIVNAGGPTTWYTDPYGRNASTEYFPGSVRQYIAAGDNSSLPVLERRAFGFSKNYGGPGTGVHAPN